MLIVQKYLENVLNTFEYLIHHNISSVCFKKNISSFYRQKYFQCFGSRRKSCYFGFKNISSFYRQKYFQCFGSRKKSCHFGFKNISSFQVQNHFMIYSNILLFTKKHEHFCHKNITTL